MTPPKGIDPRPKALRPIPPMNFRVEDLLDPDRMLNGPLVFYWGQDDRVPHRGKPIEWSEPGKMPLKFRLRRAKWWRIVVRLQPPAGEDLFDFGVRTCAALGQPAPPREPSDTEATAMWFPMLAPAKDAPGALACASVFLAQLTSLEASACQIEIERHESGGDQ